MAAGEEIEAHNNGDCGIFNDGMDDILDCCDGKDCASNLGSIQYIRDFKSKGKEPPALLLNY